MKTEKKTNYTYVISKDGKPLMPTRNGGKVRIYLKEGKAKVVRKTPFTIQLLYESPEYVQEVTLGVDPGYSHLGLSASTEREELYASETELRTDVKEKLSERRVFRRNRRTRKVRHRKPRFDNRRQSKPKGWLPPSARQKLESQAGEVAFVCSILPVSRIVLEGAAFDIQKIENPETSGKDYQNGPVKGFGHVREYVFYRDHHECQHCHGKSGDPVLETHHLRRRPEGSDRPENLITLCRSCHKNYHRGKIKLKARPKKSYRAETMMNILRFKLKEEIERKTGLAVALTYGADTKARRIQRGYRKSHAIDALMISGNTQARPLGRVYLRKKRRAHNRQIHRATMIKGGKRRRAQTDYEIFGFRLGDLVSFEGRRVYVSARRKSGYFKVSSADGSFVKDNVSWKKLRLIEKAGRTRTVLKERPLKEIKKVV